MLGYKYRSNLKYLEINGEITRIKQDANSLINHEIHTSTFDKLNDPFEFYVLEEITKLRHKLERDYGDKAKDVNKQLLEIKDFSKTIGIYSLSIQKPIQSFLSNRKLKQNCPTNELLWSHYANEHKGFCIEYDINKLKGDYILSNNVNEINIKYQLNPPNYKALKSVIKNNKDVMLTLFGIKSSSWKYENELRLIFDISGNKSYHPTALKSIYFGLNMNLEEKKFIINGLKNINVKFYQMEKSENSYILKATLLNQDSNLIKYKSTYKILKTSHNL